MAQIRNVSGQPLDVPAVGVVDIDEIFEVPDGDVYAYTASANFDPVDAAADQAHADGAEAEAIAVAAERAARGVPQNDDGDQGEDEPPSAREALIAALGELDDADEVQRVLDAENAAPSPRKTVVAAAEKRLADLDG